MAATWTTRPFNTCGRIRNASDSCDSKFKTFMLITHRCLAYVTYALMFTYHLARNDLRFEILKTRVTPETEIAVVTWPPDLPILTGRDS